MGKRKTAKTGDKALYSAREQLTIKSGKKKSGDDRTYDEVDRFHNDGDQDLIRFDEGDKQNSDNEDEDLAGNTLSVLDLGAGGASSEEDSDDDSSSNEEPSYSGKKAENYSSAEDSFSIDNDEDVIQEDLRNWGKKKLSYYHGDTADLEIGQEEDDAYLEEEAAQEIQKSRFEEMDEDDFILTEYENDSISKRNYFHESDMSKMKYDELETVRDTSKLSKIEIRKLLNKQYPELLPMTSYFSDIVKDLNDRTEIAKDLLMESEETAESVGATLKGRQYLLTKAMIQKSIALNSIMYLLLRCALAKDKDATSTIRTHPVMDHLEKLTTLLKNLEGSIHAKAKDIDSQLDNLVKAGAIMTNLVGDDNDNTLSSDCNEVSDLFMEENEKHIDTDNGNASKDESLDDSGEETDEGAGETLARNEQRDYERSLNEARFGLRLSETKTRFSISQELRPHHLDDFGDLDEEQAKLSTNELASAINTIEQRSVTASRKRRPAPDAEELDGYSEYDDQLAQGLKMIEEEMGKIDDDDNNTDAKDRDGNIITDQNGDDDALEFYSKIADRSKKKKSFKKSLYKVAPKFPRVDGEVAGERSISRVILKNRGLVAHKAKINRNPRVKKREQYRKALIRRKGAVREVRDASEGNMYGGEQTGIKSRISRSRKL